MKLALVLCIAFFAPIALSQESEPDSASRVDEPEAAPTTIEECANVEGFTDMSVLTDQHIYIRTRASNHYLVTTEYCENLERSYHQGTARLVPYGRTVCQNDGSYVVYDRGGRIVPCSILTIERVPNRTEARRLAAELPPRVEVEDATPAE